eukprot:scaffold75832_cov39-Cyclotella_meneghiniana.AAC.5
MEEAISQERELLLSQEIQAERRLDAKLKRSFNFIPDLRVTPFRNAARTLANHPLNASILPMPTNLSFHDLTPNKSIPPQAKYLLGLGSKFIPTPPKTNGRITKSIDHFVRDLKLRVFFACEDSTDDVQDHEDRSKLYLKSKWTPNDSDLPEWVNGRLDRFTTAISKLFKRRNATSNLLPLQQDLLQSLPANDSYLYPLADKGLGPCGVLTEQYIEDALIHLCNEEVYEQLTEEEAILATDVLRTEIKDWLEEYKSVIGEDAYKYINHHLKENDDSPYGQFYIMYKIHKGLKDGRWPTRPRILDALELPPNTLPFTSDAKSMYTNIKTNPALASLSKYIQEKVRGKSDELEKSALIEGLNLVLRNNIFRFGDTYWRQISETAMGTPPAPPYATIFYALYEKELVPRWKKHVFFYKRFIDDVIAFWTAHEDPVQNDILWKEFEADMNKWHGLKWVCTKPSHSVNFMDLTISVVNGRIETKLVRRLCTHKTDADSSIRDFLDRLLARGHTRESLQPMFANAEANATSFLRRSQDERKQLKIQKRNDSNNQLFFHLQFHPNDPTSREIQSIWRDTIAEPEGETPLCDLENLEEQRVGINKLVVAYSRPMNLGNRFSVRDIHDRGKPVSHYLAK